MSVEIKRKNRKPPADAAPAPPCTLVIFGASGDLTRRLLVPALYNLAHDQLLDTGFQVIGVDRVERTDESFRAYLAEAMESLDAQPGAEGSEPALDASTWAWLATRMRYVTGAFDDRVLYHQLAERLSVGPENNRHAAVFYLATPPQFFAPIIEQLHAAGLTVTDDAVVRRIVIEKPFGADLMSARNLNARILQVSQESQLYRIDHFLGKETVRNIMVLRFANGIFEPVWNREHIDHVQITAAETLGVEHRGAFYDRTGALRDMVVNHIFQLLALTAMEAPNSFEADAVRSEKVKVLGALRRWSMAEASANGVRGQYTAGTIRGRPVSAYREEPDIPPHSNTETFVALKLLIDNWRWADVPFYVRTGKALAARRTHIAIHFKRAPDVLFRETAADRLQPNIMKLRIQPDEGISLRFAVKTPGLSVRLAEVDMDFLYSDYFNTEPATGYETLIYDCLIGDSTLFQRADHIEAGWTAVQPFLDAWGDAAAVEPYRAGSNGPAGADTLLARDGRDWIPLE